MAASNDKLKQQIRGYLYWQMMVGMALSVIFLLLLLAGSRKWEGWIPLYTLIPALGCTLINLGAAFTLKHTFGLVLPTVSKNKRVFTGAVTGLLLVLELLLYFQNG